MGRLRVSGISGWALTLLVSFALVGCGGDGSGNSAPVTSVQLSGIVVDGPVVAGDVRVTDADGTLLGQTTTDGAARFALEVPVEEATFPLTIVVSGGTNLVTGAPPEVALASFVNGPWENVTANVTPFSTLVVGVAERLPDGMTVANVGVANQLVREAMSFGLDASEFDQVVVVPIIDGTLPKYLKASESLAEMLRRTTEELMITGQVASATQVLESLQADLVDGVVDGLGAPGADDRTAAISHVVTAQVLLESITNALQVNGTDAGNLLDGALQQVLTVPNPALTMDSVMVTAAALEQTSDAVFAAMAVEDDPMLATISDRLTDISPNTSPDTVAAMLPVDSGNALEPAIVFVRTADAEDLEKVNKRPRGKAKGHNGDPVIIGTPPSQVTAGVLYSFVPSASDPEGDALSFSIQGKPAWATFDSTTGRLQGTPDVSDVGTFSNIQIAVSDGRESTPMSPFNITVSTMPNQAPTIGGTPASQVTVGNAYSFTPSAADPDGDVLSFSIQGRPAWATFNSNNGRLNGTPGAGSAATYSNIRITVTDGTDSRTLPAFAITVNDLPNQAPTISGTPATQVTVGNAYSFTPNAADPDGDALSFSIQGRPAWATFNSNTGRLNGTPGVGNVGTFSNIRITVTAGSDSRTLPAFAITVNDLPNQAPTISGTPATQVTVGNAYSFTPNASDPDGDTLSFSIQGKPGWAGFNTGTGRLNGTPGVGDVAGYSNIRITVTDGNDSRTLSAFAIAVNPVASQSVFQQSSAGLLVMEAERFDLNVGGDGMSPWTVISEPNAANTQALKSPAGNLTVAPDSPHSEYRANFLVAGSAYVWVRFRAFDSVSDSMFVEIDNLGSQRLSPRPVTGQWEWAQFLYESPISAGEHAVKLYRREGDLEIDRVVLTMNASFTPTGVGPAESPRAAPGEQVPPPVNLPPIISGTPPTQVTAGNSYSFTPNGFDGDGDPLSYSIQGKPAWASFNSSTGRLSGTPAGSNVGTYSNVRIAVFDGQDTASLPAFAITVSDLPNQPPSISGNPASQVTVGSSYSFTPNASDPDGDTLNFSIQGKPAWASFNSSTGRLNGTPAGSNVATYSNIRITVSDGQDSRNLADFSIIVNDLPNQPPTISGVAATQVMANQPYSFTPNASDPDGDPMSFGIQGRPPWASFNSANGRLEGTPGQADIGTFGNIRISVTDGEDSAQLAAFTIEVVGTATGGFTLTWDAPQTNIDGSPLTDLAGYKVYLGTEPGSYGPAIIINNPGVTTYVFDQLAPGTYYVTVRSVDINGNESPPSQEASATI